MKIVDRAPVTSRTNKQGNPTLKGMFGHLMHIAISYGVAIALVLVAVELDWLKGEYGGVIVAFALVWAFVSWFATRDWEEWGSPNSSEDTSKDKAD